MWCSSCQQDVPAASSHEDSSTSCCARCRRPFETPAEHAATSVRPAIERVEIGFSPLPPLVDDWELESDLRSVEHVVNSFRQRGMAPTPGATPHELPAAAMPVHQRREPQPRERGGLAIWAILSLGVMTFVCGGVLLGWSFAADRADLRTLGLPLTLAGQAALIIGLVLQLEGLWSSNKQTREALDELDGQLHELRHATTLMTTTHSAPGQSFYAHMAEGASPHLLLADLKGQMDLLAQRMASQRG